MNTLMNYMRSQTNHELIDKAYEIIDKPGETIDKLHMKTLINLLES